MTAFDRAWALLKTDVRLPSPAGMRPSFFDQHANLAFHGSMIPQSQSFENPTIPDDDDPYYDRDTKQSFADADVLTPDRHYMVGHFSEGMKDGTIDRDWQNSFNPPSRLGAELLVNEIDRASIIEALNESGILEEDEIDRIFQDMHQFEEMHDQLDYSARRMDNNKGWQMNKPLRRGRGE